MSGDGMKRSHRSTPYRQRTVQKRWTFSPRDADAGSQPGCTQPLHPRHALPRRTGGVQPIETRVSYPLTPSRTPRATEDSGDRAWQWLLAIVAVPLLVVVVPFLLALAALMTC
jgi:hypothetical protein